MSEILLLTGAFFLPLISYILNFFTKEKNIPQLTHQENLFFQKEYLQYCLGFVAFLPPFIFIFLIVSCFDGIINTTKEVLEVLTSIPMHGWCVIEIGWLEFITGLYFMCLLNTVGQARNIFKFKFIKENFIIFEAILPFFIVFILPGFYIISIQLENLSPKIYLIILLFFPISMYFYTKRVYEKFMYQKKYIWKIKNRKV